MRASYYNHENKNKTQSIMEKYAHELPNKNQSVSSIDWYSDFDEIICLDELEKYANIPFTDEEMNDFFHGDMKVSELHSIVSSMEKQARLQTSEEKAKGRAYYQRNKERLKRKARIRYRRQKSGVQKKSKRIGNAATGYSFIEKSPTPSGGKQKTSVSGPEDKGNQQFVAPDSGTTRPKKNIRSGKYITR